MGACRAGEACEKPPPVTLAGASPGWSTRAMIGGSGLAARRRRRYFLTSISFVRKRISVLSFLLFLRTITVRVAVPFFGISLGTVTFQEQRPSSSGVCAWPEYAV
jgi:hypothetical protein